MAQPRMLATPGLPVPFDQLPIGELFRDEGVTLELVPGRRPKDFVAVGHTPKHMRRLPAFAHLALASGFLLWSVACATSEVHAPQSVAGRARATTLRPEGPAAFDSVAPGSLASRSSGALEPGNGRIQAHLLPVGLREMGDGRLKLFRPWLPLDRALEALSVEDVSMPWGSESWIANRSTAFDSGGQMPRR